MLAPDVPQMLAGRNIPRAGRITWNENQTCLEMDSLGRDYVGWTDGERSCPDRHRSR